MDLKLRSGLSVDSKEKQLAKLINVGHLHFFPFIVSPGAVRLVFCVGRRAWRAAAVSGLVQYTRVINRIHLHKYPNRLTSSGGRKSQLLLLKLLCIEYKRVCVSGNIMSLFKLTLSTLGSKMMLLKLEIISC